VDPLDYNIPARGGAEMFLASATDGNASWPPAAGDAQHPDTWMASNNTNVTGAITGGNATNITVFVDPPVNEALMAGAYTCPHFGPT
jgi:hypothetical protein